jgi:hypothetical protein
MNVGVLGSGDVAKALGVGFLIHGHDVTLGTRDPAKLADWLEENPGVRVGTFEEAAAHGELLALAVKGSAAEDVLALAGAENLAGKPVIDATNPLADSPPVNGVLRSFTGPNDSLMERLQSAHPDARFVKAFNSVGNAQMVGPQLKGGPPTMFICGNDESAKATVHEVLDAFGWETEDMGGVEAARAIEPLCILWCVPGFLGRGWDHAFKLLR